MRVLGENLLDLCSVNGLALVGFPASNLQHPHLSKRWRSTLLENAAAVFDAGAGSTVEADLVFIAQHNLTASAVVKVQANDLDDWTTPSVDITLTWAGYILIGYPTLNHRFVRLLVDDPTNEEAYIEIGRAGAGLYAQLTVKQEGLIDDVEDSTVDEESVTGQPFADLGVISRVYEVPLGTVSLADRNILIALYAAVGKHTPILVLLDETDLVTLPPLYCRLRKNRRLTHAGYTYWDAESLLLKEAF